jgi:hypothetical protein
MKPMPKDLDHGKKLGAATCEIVERCTLEWDRYRGVLYVHNRDGRTILRIQYLDQDFSFNEDPTAMMDIYHDPSQT